MSRRSTIAPTRQMGKLRLRGVKGLSWCSQLGPESRPRDSTVHDACYGEAFHASPSAFPWVLNNSPPAHPLGQQHLRVSLALA